MRIFIILLTLLFLSCSGNQKVSDAQSDENNDINKIYKSEFQTIIDSFDVMGSTLVYDLN